MQVHTIQYKLYDASSLEVIWTQKMAIFEANSEKSEGSQKASEREREMKMN